MFRIYEAGFCLDRLPGVSHRVTLCSYYVAEVTCSTRLKTSSTGMQATTLHIRVIDCGQSSFI